MRLRDDSASYVVVGAFVVAMLAALVLWIGWLSGRGAAGDTYTSRFDSVMGVAEGTEVRFEGYRVGRVEAISPTGRGDFELELSVRRGWPLPEDSAVAVASGGLLSAPVLNISGGGSSDLLSPGAEIPSRPTTDLFGSVAELSQDLSELVRDGLGPMIGSVSEDAPELLEGLLRVSQRLEEAGDSLAAMLGESSQERVAQLLDNLEDGSADFRALASELRGTRAQLDEVLGAVDQTVSEGGPTAVQALAELRVALEAVARHAETVSHNLEVTTRNFGELSADLRRDPSLLLRGRDGDVEEELGEVP